MVRAPGGFRGLAFCKTMNHHPFFVGDRVVVVAPDKRPLKTGVVADISASGGFLLIEEISGMWDGRRLWHPLEVCEPPEEPA